MTQLGFGSAPRARYIYANRGAGDTWYMLDSEGTPVACPTNALTGHITNLEFKQLERRGQAVWKLHLTIEADCKYVIESGKDTVFSRCVMSALAVLTKQQLSQPITVEARPARNAESLFCNFYIAGERVKCYWNSETQWRSVAQAAILLFLEDEPELQPVTRQPVAQLQPMDHPINEHDDIAF